MGKLNHKQMIMALGAFVFAAILFLTPRPTEDTTFWYSIAVGILMILFWLFEVVPIYVTAMFPFIFAIPLGILTPEQLTAAYGHKFIYLFFGGFVLSLALEKWDVHKQIAEGIIRVVGTSKSRIILGFLLSTALLSMWISNTATALMMLPMALAVLSKVPQKGKSKFPVFLLLSVAYGASIGGMATLVGSPPNILMAGLIDDKYGIKVDFATWMGVGLPLSLIMLGIVFLFFYLLLGKERSEAIEEVRSERKKWTANQKRVMVLFLCVVLLWSFRSLLTDSKDPSGFHYSDEGVAVLGAILLFFLPGKKKDEKLLDWSDTKRLPWGILLLFGGGMALAKMLEVNGVIDQLTLVFQSYADAPLYILLTVLVAIAIFGTEIMSNMALVSVFIPVVADFALKTDFTILQLCMPITLAASCAFMLPVGTPPNAIVFSSGMLKINQMARTGFVLNVIGVLIVVTFSMLLF
ncbi:MAG: DASS family sodium-coupled anion symporter [Crocinitomicaceae bacterium]|nr:DASS family sodium-coupled anion symporter [Crocinitomicaceae bacterium]